MENKLYQIINEATDSVLIAETKVNELRSKITFCINHNFKEEERIASVELKAMEMVTYNYRQTIEQLETTLKAWES